MELKDTVQMMESVDYKERFKAEYLQAKIRYDKLDAMTVKNVEELEFAPEWDGHKPKDITRLLSLI